MCYDVSFTADMKTLSEYLPMLNVSAGEGFEEREHVQAQAFNRYPVIVNEDGDMKVEMWEWGVIAPYMNTPEKIKKSRSFMCNAQSEKIIHEPKSFWHRIRKNRCLIPVTGIFEHRGIEGWKHKVPYFVREKHRKLFCIPGLYNFTPDKETGEAKGTYTLITRAANSVMEKIHNSGPNDNRMPMFLADKKMELRWIAPDLTDKEIDEVLDYEIPSDHLDYHPVYTIRTTKPRPDGKDKTAEYHWKDLPAL